jgi:methylglutaconyl-CoA hydratase
MAATLDIERQGAIATVWMNRPEVHNAFDETLIAELTAAFAALGADAGVRVVVLGGRGKHFSAGADLNWMRRAAANSVAANEADAQRFAALLAGIDRLGKPTIARVQGAALGGGTGLTAACDMAVASDDAEFATSEVRFGILPAVISPYVLRAIGPRQALRYFQSGERIPAAQAQAIGLVHEVVAAAALDARVAALAASLLAGAPGAQRAARALIADVAGRPIDDALSAETARRIAGQRATAEAREGFAAFFEKRPPAWRE